MKTLMSFILTGLLLIISYNSFSAGSDSAEDQQADSRELIIATSPDLSGFVSVLASAWHSATGRSTEVIDNRSIPDDGNIMIIYGDEIQALQTRPQWKIVIGHEIVVPVINPAHPILKELLSRGLTAGEFGEVLSAGVWPEGLHVEKGMPCRIYIPDNNRIGSKIAEFSGAGSLNAVKLASSAEVVSAVGNDKYGIGFCRLTDAMVQGENRFSEGISVIPIDKNCNGKIDGFENIYSSPDELTRGVWIGKYSRKLCSNIYAVSVSGQVNEETGMFLTWALNDGQQELASVGYSSLLTRERTAGMMALRNPVSQPGSANPSPVLPVGWKLLIGLGIIALLVVALTLAGNRKKLLVESDDIVITQALNVNSVRAPAGLLYDKTHTWAFMEKDGMVKVGMNDFMGHITGVLSQVKMKSPGEQVRKGEKMMSIVRDGKQLDIYSPVTGVIRKQNQLVSASPEKVYADPYEEGWIYQVEPLNWVREVRFMFMAGKFREWLDDEFTRLKDFLAASANSSRVVYEHVVLQDGGELTDNVLADLGPEVWDDFQTHFIDVSK